MVAVLVGGDEGSTLYAVDLITAGAGAEGHTGDGVGAGYPESWPGNSATLHLPTLLERQSYGTLMQKEAHRPSSLGITKKCQSPSKLQILVSREDPPISLPVPCSIPSQTRQLKGVAPQRK